MQEEQSATVTGAIRACPVACTSEMAGCARWPSASKDCRFRTLSFTVNCLAIYFWNTGCLGMYPGPTALTWVLRHPSIHSEPSPHGGASKDAATNSSSVDWRSREFLQ